MDRTRHLRCLVVLPGLTEYRDRYRMFADLSRHGLAVRIHSHNRDAAAAGMDGEVSVPPASGTVRKWRCLRGVVRRFSRPGGRIVLHDLFVPRAGLFCRRRWAVTGGRRVRNVLSIYSPNADFCFRARWRNIGGQAVLAREVPHYLYGSLRWVAWEWTGVRLVDGLIGNTDQIVADALRYYRLGDRRARVIPTCVDVRFWSPGGPADRAADRAYLLFAGNTARRKGLGMALEAMAKLRGRRGEVKLKVAGHYRPESGYPWHEEAIDRLGLRGRVELLGVVDRPTLRRLYRGAAAMVLPSLHEGSPRAVKEAAACGCPVITTRIPGTTIVDPTGEFLRYCRPADADGIATWVEKLLDRPGLAEEIARRGRERMTSHFSPAVIAARTADFYRRLHEAGPAAGRGGRAHD